MPAARFGPAPLLRPRLVQLIGDISYSAYLWHWPLLVALPFTRRCAAPALARGRRRADAADRLVLLPPRRGSAAPRAASGPARAARTLALAAVASAFVSRRAGRRDGLHPRPGARRARASPSASPTARRLLRRRSPRSAPAVLNPRRSKRGHTGADRGGAIPQRALRAHRPLGPDQRLRVRRAGDAGHARDRAYRRQPRLALARRARRRWRSRGLARRLRDALRLRVLEANKRARPALYAACRALARGGAALAGPPSADPHDLRLRHHRRRRDRQGRTQRPRHRGRRLRQAWAGLPDSVRRVVVLRDTPRVRASTVACVQRALDAHPRPPAPAVSRARSR